MKLFAVVSYFPLVLIVALTCAVSSALGQEVFEAPQVLPATEAGNKATEVTETDDFPDKLRARAPKTLAEVKLLELRVQKLVEKIRPATISIFGGTGVVVGKDGYILSAGHVVVEPGRKIQIRFPDGTRATAITLGVNDRYDSGMAKITSDGEFPFVEMGESADLELGEWCLAVGFPVSFSRNQEPPVRLGRILSNRSRTIISDCTIMGGDSGGPLFNLDGEVIGINSRVSGSLNQNVHVPVDVFTRDWDSLTKNEIRDKAGKLKPAPSDRGFMGISWKRGESTTEIGQVLPGFGAEKAGLKDGDLILEIDGAKTKAISDVTKLLSTFPAGRKISVKVLRSDEEINFQVTLSRRP